MPFQHKVVPEPPGAPGPGDMNTPGPLWAPAQCGAHTCMQVHVQTIIQVVL